MKGFEITLTDLYIVRNGLTFLMRNALDAQKHLVTTQAYKAIGKEYDYISELKDRISEHISEIEAAEQSQDKNAEDGK